MMSHNNEVKGKAQRPKNVTSKQLSEKEAETFSEHLGLNCYSLASGLGQVIAADSKNLATDWTVKYNGIITFVKDYNERDYFVRLISLKKGLLWSIKISSENLVLKQSTDHILNLLHQNGEVFGLCFKDKAEAVEFRSTWDKKCAYYDRRDELTQAQETAAPEEKETAPKFKKTSFKGKLKKQSIGPPVNFRHNMHIRQSKSGTLRMAGDPCNPDPTLKSLLQQIGVENDSESDFIRKEIEKLSKGRDIQDSEVSGEKMGVNNKSPDLEKEEESLKGKQIEMIKSVSPPSGDESFQLASRHPPLPPQISQPAAQETEVCNPQQQDMLAPTASEPELPDCHQPKPAKPVPKPRTKQSATTENLEANHRKEVTLDKDQEAIAEQTRDQMMLEMDSMVQSLSLCLQEKRASEHLREEEHQKLQPVGQNIARSVTLHKCPEGYGFALKSECPTDVLLSAGKPSRSSFLEVEPGSVADEAGIREGDYLLKINYVDVRRMGHEDVIELFKGAKEQVFLSVITGDENDKDNSGDLEFQ